MINKVDFKKSLKQFYNPPKGGFHFVDVPIMNFLMVDGRGDPNISDEYRDAVQALYSLSYALKFALKKQGYEYVVPPLEGLWWMDDMNEFTIANKHRWEWTMMIMQPVWMTGESVEGVRRELSRKKSLPSLNKIRFKPYHEGLAVQTLYIGSYVDEAPTIAAIHKFIASNNHCLSGKHHEIYLGDPNKTSAERLKTIIRQPVRAKP